jgi:nucleoside-diphosphate-sugar epimerase
MAKWIVTGGAGFVGSKFSWRFNRHGDEVIVIDNIATPGKKNM